MAVHTVLFCLLLILFPLLLTLKKLKKQNKQLLPPGPPKLPVLGNVHQLGELPHQTLWKLSKKYGPVMLLKFGRIPVVAISSAETAREVLKVHDLDCCSRPPLASTRKLTYNYLDVAFSPYSEYWRELKKIYARELFSSKRVRSFRFIREEEVTMLMNSISQSANPVDLSEKIFGLSGSIIFRMAFGKRSNLDDRRFQELIHAAEAVLRGFTAGECFQYVGWIIDRLTGYHAKLEKAFHGLDTFFEERINDHLNPHRTKQEQDDVIDVMLKMGRDQSESKVEAQLTKDHIKAVLLDLYLGGVDTSAITVIWAMAELSRKPRLMKKAQDEIRNRIGKKGRVNEADIDQLQYLKMIIKETLRLHPPGPLLVARETMSHFKVNDYDICPKTVIQVNAWAIGRDPKYWKNPEEFFPDRFLDNSIDLRGQHFEYLPFGSGRRICPGLHMGLITSELALANLLYCFDWKLPNGMNEDDVNMEETTGSSLLVSRKMPLLLVPVNYLP
ncbi:Cytochrome P450 [Melia azedarach]|uniref:Cytochrome P450 n=1 Tax=Melia azedarach TaxID=155640 RepID=A0ACC1XHZ6_MELAZ|nr:Cytochrome P450 [Melia azedarach]